MTASSDADVDNSMMSAVRSKLERIQQLRRHHQQTHRERQGRYLHDDVEDLYEQQLRRYEQVIHSLQLCFIIFLLPTFLGYPLWQI